MSFDFNAVDNRIVAMDNQSIYAKIMAYLNELGHDSNNTKTEYKRDIEQFFQIMRHKSLGELNPNDLLFDNAELKQYKSILFDQYSPSTVNRKLSSVKSVFVELSKDYPDINLNVFTVKKIKSNPNSIGVLYWEEVNTMIELLESKQTDKDINKEKAIMIELATRTSIRLSALLNIKMCDISKPKDKSFYVVRVIDKGRKVDEKPIPESLYQKIKGLNRGFTDNVFTLAKRTFQRCIEDLCLEIGIDAGRNISFHSLKKVGIQWVLENTGSITLAAKQGNHSNIQTTHKHYLDLERMNQMENLAGLNIDKELDDSILMDLTKDELISIINGLGGSVKRQVLTKGQVILESRQENQ